MIIKNFDPQNLGRVLQTEASVFQIKRCLKAAKEFLNVKFKDIVCAKIITTDNDLWQAVICYTEGYKGFGIALGDWRFPESELAVFSLFFMPKDGFMMEIHKGHFYDVLPLFPQTNGELVTAYRRGEGNANKGIYYKIPDSENWFYVRNEGQEFSENCEYSFEEKDFAKMSVEKMETAQWFPSETYANHLQAIWDNVKDDVNHQPVYIDSCVLSGIKK